MKTKAYSIKFIIISVLSVSILSLSTICPPFLHKTHSYELQYDTMAMPKPYIPADNPMTEEAVYLGRLLFYDTLLSGNKEQSCGSCHIQKYSFTDGKKVAEGSTGKKLKRNTPSLINLAWSKYYFWDGRTKSLENLIFEPILSKDEMGANEKQLLKDLNKHPYYPILFFNAFGQKKITRPLVEKALAQFLRSITSKGIHLPENVLNNPPKGMSEAEYYYQNIRDTTLRGLYFRFANMCGTCHRSEIYNDPDLLATNLVNSKDTLMKVPTLINITKTAPYMHDGRFSTISEVFEHYDQHISELNLPENTRIKERIANQIINNYDKKNIETFMQYFVDSNLLTNKQWANPFNQTDFCWLRSLNNKTCAY